MTRVMVAIILATSFTATGLFATDIEERVSRLVADGSKSALAELYDMARSNDKSVRASSALGITRVATRMLLEGDNETARYHANNIWLSSSPNEARQMAWKILYLVENQPEHLPDGHRLTILAPGSRDHARFETWLRERTTEKHQWIIGLRITYEPTMISPGRAGENAVITLVIKDREDEPELFRILSATPAKYPTDDWRIVQLIPIRSN